MGYWGIMAYADDIDVSWDATGFFGVFFPGEMQWGSRGKTRVALCTLGKHIVTLSLGKVTPGSNA